MSSIEEMEELMTPAEVARRIGVSPITVRSWVSKGWLKSRLTPGGHRRYLWADVERLLKEKNQTSAPPKAAKILIVDDDPQFRAYLAEALSLLIPEAILKEAHDGFLAGMLVAEFQPELILLDYAMPGINGAEVCRKIKSNPTHVRTRIVGVTGYADPDILNDLKIAGIDKMLHKPVDLKELETMLEQFKFKTIAV